MYASKLNLKMAEALTIPTLLLHTDPHEKLDIGHYDMLRKKIPPNYLV
jgi:hypothetical protein